ncbi:MAG: TerB family tellurite resistance protein [Chamaesiphon sp.]|nr:TerB family tellurite resistance protein [Chamaesiphon sp.]
MPLIAPFIIQSVLPLLSTIFALLVPVLGEAIKFALTRIPKIPSYLLLLKVLYSDMDSSSKDRKILTTGILVIGSITTFMAYSLIPFTGVPLIGAVTSSIAAVIAIVVALVVLDMMFAMNQGYYRKQLEKQGFARLDDIEADIKGLQNIFGKSLWQQIKSTIKDSSQKIFEESSKYGIDVEDKNYKNYIDDRLDILNIYISRNSVAKHQDINTSLLMQNDGQDWTKDASILSTGASVGAFAGVGASVAASSVLVQAGFITSLQGLFGASTGIVVSASTYSLLTFAAPIGLGVLATVGICSGLTGLKNKEEAAKMSKFLSDIMISALPMAWIDGELSHKERDTIDRFVTTSGIRKEDQDLVWEAVKKQQTFDEVMETGSTFENIDRQNTCKQSSAERIKHRLILCTAWDIAIADAKIYSSALYLHNRMADKLGISRDEVKEIRRAINLKYDGDLWAVKEALEPNASEAKLLSVREQYRLQAGR